MIAITLQPKYTTMTLFYDSYTLQHNFLLHYKDSNNFINKKLF